MCCGFARAPTRYYTLIAWEVHGQRRSIGHLYHIKDVSGVQSCPFNYLCHRNVAAKAGSVHSMFPNDQELGQKGKARPHPQHTTPSASRTIILNQVLTGRWKSTGSLQFHKHHTASTSTQLLHSRSATLPTQELT